MNTTEVVVGNKHIQVLNVESSIKLQITPLHNKENRKKLSEVNLIELFEKATKNCYARFDLMWPSLANEHELDDTYNVGIMVEKAKADMNRYVMNDVFTSVLVGADGKSVTGSKDLFTD